MKPLLVLATVLLLSACGSDEDIPSTGYEPSAVQIDTQGAHP